MSQSVHSANQEHSEDILRYILIAKRGSFPHTVMLLLTMLKIDKQKYFQIVDAEGLSAALTALHHDYRDWEFESFEGEHGYQPEMWSDLEELREFSRDLWNRISAEPSAEPNNKAQAAHDSPSPPNS